MRHRLVWLGLVSLLGCTSQDEGLLVNLQTDLRAGVEFDLVTVDIDGTQRHSVEVGTSDLFGRARYITSYPALTPGRHAIRISLLEGGAERATRTLSIVFTGSYLATAVIARTCVEFPCAPGLSCAGGRCVSTDCVTGLEPSCPGGACTAASDCSSVTSCARPLCAAGICLEEPDDSSCRSSELCVVGMGCISPVRTPDASAPDASARPDAAMSPDAAAPPDAAMSPDAAAPPDARTCAAEACDGRDNDCDGSVDETGCGVLGTSCTAIQGGSSGRVYQYCPTRLSRPGAQAACEQMGYDLAGLGDATEEARIVPAVAMGGMQTWIGLSDVVVEGEYWWSDGTRPVYLNWAPGEPNNYVDEDCVRIRPSGLWDDYSCELVGSPFLCERAVVP